MSDELSHELSRTHNLGNLNVRQSEKCIEDIRGKGEIREKHSDITGGDRRRLTMERIKISDEVQKLIPSDFASTQTGTYAVLAPLVRALHTKPGRCKCNDGEGRGGVLQCAPSPLDLI